MPEGKYKIGGLYVWLDDETVMSWFKARAFGGREDVEAQRKAASEVVKASVAKFLGGHGFIGIRFKWSRTAGCRCGCSPGYIITASGHKYKKAVGALNHYGGSRNLFNFWFEKGKLSGEIGAVEKSYSKVGMLAREISEVTGLHVGERRTIATTAGFKG